MPLAFDPSEVALPLRFPLPAPLAAHRSARIMIGSGRLGRCLVGTFDPRYLAATYFPDLIRRTFGEQDASQFDFAVLRRGQPGQPLLGSAPVTADVKQPFFFLRMEDLLDHARQGFPTGPGQQNMIVQQFTAPFVNYSRRQSPNGGFWELQVARKGGPLDYAVVVWRRKNVMLSAGVEVLLLAAIGFLLVSTRRMQRLADQKMQFVAGVSHELRTPVSAIAMLARNQADGLVNGPEQVKQYGALIHQQSQRLNEMVEQTLHYAGIQSGRRQPALREVDLPAVIEGALSARRGDLARAGFHVEVEIEPDIPTVWGDPQWLERAIDNLLSNAEKYARDQRWIRVCARYAAEKQEVQVTVEDHGIGIDPADFDQIFEPFCRGRRAVEAQIPGTGIGLSLVRSTAEAHRGSVTFVSEPDRGSAFTLHLPAAASVTR
jgi:signal transduction histidine kinase